MAHDRRPEIATCDAPAALLKHETEEPLDVRNLVGAQADTGPVRETSSCNLAVARCVEQAATELRHVMLRTVTETTKAWKAAGAHNERGNGS